MNESIPLTDIDLKKLLDQFNEMFEFEATSMNCQVDITPNGDVCNWHLVMKNGKRIMGTFPVFAHLSECALAMATGMGLELHPQKQAIVELMFYASTVSGKNPVENALGDLVVRGWLWHRLSTRYPKGEALNRLIADLHIKENIDLVYRTRGELNARKGLYAKPQ